MDVTKLLTYSKKHQIYKESDKNDNSFRINITLSDTRIAVEDHLLAIILK
jgi:hypothetical protein